jgi:Tol biopolymer transport system component/DNA-binding winged helix-turn-helix (wHTH) protein
VERPTHLSSSVHFGPFELDVRSAELRYNGHKVLLHEQPFQVLLALLERPGELIGREELVHRLWPDGTFVDYERGLNKAVNKLRDALHDSADSPRFVETIPRRGYRFIAPLEGGAAITMASGSPVAVKAGTQHKIWLAIGVALMLSVMGSGVYRFTRRQPSAPREIKLRKLTFNSAENRVQSGAISPDGKYLTYIDGKGIHIRLLETGENQVVPEPEALKGAKVNWEICPWFPDSTRFLVNAHPASERLMDWSSQTASIWMVSVLGGAPRKLRDSAAASGISPDGSAIAFSTNKGSFGDREIWLMGANGENARKLYESDDNGAIFGLLWLPHGQRVAYVSTDKSGDTLVTRELRGGPVTAMLSPSDSKKINDGTFLPDGRFLYTLPEADAVGNSCNYWTMRLDERTGTLDNKPTRLTNWGGGCMGGTSVTADGKKLIFNEWKMYCSVYVTDVAPNGTPVSGTRHLTLTESWDIPADWTPDSKQLILLSNRNGHMGIFKQSLNEDTAEPLVTSPEDVIAPKVTPDGVWVVYAVSTKPNDQSAPVKIMRVPITGGPSEFVLTAQGGYAVCAKPPAKLCTLIEDDDDHKQVVFTAFDPLGGRGRELARIDSDPQKYFNWDLSPDGTRIAYVNSHEGPVHIVSLRGEPSQEIRVKGWSNLQDIEWADAKALLISNRVRTGDVHDVLLHVDMQGNARVLWQQQGGFNGGGLGKLSPDGRHLAFNGMSRNSNIWMMENF